MVDGVVLLVDASEGPLPQTRFVLRKALAAKLPVILVVNKIDRPDARIAEVVTRRPTCCSASRPTCTRTSRTWTSTRSSTCPSSSPPRRPAARRRRSPPTAACPTRENLEPLFDHPRADPGARRTPRGAPLQAHVTNLDASPFLGRLALLRVYNGTIRKGQQVAWATRRRHAAERQDHRAARDQGARPRTHRLRGPRDIVAVAGIEDITIGETLTDPDDPRPLPLITVDDPAISMTIGINTSPLAGGGKGHKVTARQVKDRLDKELVGNVSLRVLPTERPDAWEVQGRGELALAILVEQMRREGFELTVGKPQVVTSKVDGKMHEPVERMTIDVPEEYLGAVTQLLAQRKGRMETMSNHGTGWVRMEFLVPARGLIGFRTRFLTDTRGTGIASSISEGYEPWAGPIETRINGSLVADRSGPVTPFAMINLQERGSFFVQPTQEVYEGQIVGENSRNEDMDVNITKEKKLTNMRVRDGRQLREPHPAAQPHARGVARVRPRGRVRRGDARVVRIRKVVLDQTERARITARSKRA